MGNLLGYNFLFSDDETAGYMDGNELRPIARKGHSTNIFGKAIFYCFHFLPSF